MAKSYWLVKQEPSSYSWDTFVKEGKTAWTSVRNYQARIYLRTMKPGDAVLFYHSGEAREVVGLAEVIRAAYPDPTATEGDWSAVDLAALEPLRKPVTLSTIKEDPVLKEMTLVRLSRISVTPVSAPQFKRIIALSKSKQ